MRVTKCWLLGIVVFAVLGASGQSTDEAAAKEQREARFDALVGQTLQWPPQPDTAPVMFFNKEVPSGEKITVMGDANVRRANMRKV